MKARIKKTGEIINIASYAHVTLEACDSYGSPIELGFDEVEILEKKESNIDWEQRRYELAKAAMQGIISSFPTGGNKIDSVIFPERRDVSVTAITYADDMIYCLKGSYYDKANNT